jgi:ribonuclease-3
VPQIDRDLLQLALTHRSILNEDPAVTATNERLEFLGDAVVGTVIADEVYRKYPNASEGELTQARSAIVRGDTLAGVAERLELGRHLYMGRGEEADGGRERTTNLAAAFEALVGALFVDQGYKAASELVVRALSTELLALGRRSTFKSPKSTLQEAGQSKGQLPPVYTVADISGQAHDRMFTVEVSIDGTVVGRGTGKRKSLAEEEAALEGLKVISTEDP